MQQILIISVGKKHDVLLADAIAHYEGRLKHYCKLSWLLIPSSSAIEETAAILHKLNNDDVVILLDETGKSIANQQLADMIDSAQNQSVKRLVFIIGGAYGVTEELKERANQVISLSSLIFPHQLVRLILLEQLYRSYSILAGSSYHHE